MTGLAATDEAALLARCRSGAAAERDAAFAHLFEALHPRVHGLCRQILGNAADAEDAVQEIFLAIHRGLARFRGESQLATWVYRIALRVALRLRGRRQRRRAAPLEQEPAAPPAAPGAGASDLQRRIAAAMEQLPVNDRTVLSLFAVDGLPHAEIAAILGVPVGTVWSRLHAARKRLKAALDRT